MGDVLGMGRFPDLDAEKLARHNARAVVEQKKDKRRALVAAHSRGRQAATLKRTPPWADLEKIKELYRQASEISRRTGMQHHVDHVIPLQGALVSGLHVHTNLQVIPATDNLKKRNKFTP